jgi:uncharacterized protein YigA (DUF484 family)
MTGAPTSDLNDEFPREDAVERYLRAHPDFFERHADLLELLRIPHRRNGAISLVERQMDVLRSRNRELERKLLHLVQVARDNESLSARLHRLALALIEAEDLHDVIATSKDLLRTEFPSAWVVLRLLSQAQDRMIRGRGIGDNGVEPSLFDSLFEAQRPLCCLLTEAQARCLFDREAPNIASSVMIPLMDGKRLGVLALGSADHNRFSAGMGTLFLRFLGELVSRALVSHLAH